LTFPYYRLSHNSKRSFSNESILENEDASALTNASGQVVHALNNTVTQFAGHTSSVSTSGLPIAAATGFVPGLLTGFKKG
jgi:hypothetical protein